MRTSFSVNDMTIHRIVEQESGFTPMLDFLPTLSKETLGENLAWLAPGGYDSASGNVVLCFQSYVVKTPHHNILVDSCIGNDKNFPLRPAWNKKNDGNWMNALKAAGLGVEDIDFVMCTHLHGDHVGWNTRLENGRWVPTFPKARFLFSMSARAGISSSVAATLTPCAARCICRHSRSAMANAGRMATSWNAQDSEGAELPCLRA